MSYRRKDSPVWWASYVDASGKRVRRSTGTTDRKEADALEAKWKLEAYRENQWEEQPGRTFEELMLVYMQATATEKRSHDRDRSSAKQLRKQFHGRDMKTLSPADIRAYIANRREAGIRAGTINREIGLLSAALNWARKELNWNLPNPVQGRRLRAPEGRIRWISRSEAEALLDAARANRRAGHLVDFIRMALHTGMRRGEILGLEWRRVDLDRDLIYLEGCHQKNGKIGSVPLNQEARAALQSRASFRAKHCPDSPWVFAHRSGERIQSVKNAFASACRKVEITDFRIHDLRHSCAAWLVQAGVSIRAVAELLRHSDIRVTMRYAHLAPENVRAAVSVLEAVESRSGHVDSTTAKTEQVEALVTD